ncbi:MAG: group 1 truncated hemoglobin [Gammaproteobacteria bacterium]|nr:group 1 truncated hemoglobin [Gammaproteobacteria bacterium]
MRLVLSLLAAALLSACAAQKAPPASLYDQLGQTAGIDQVVGTFIQHVAADKRIVHFFAKTDLKHLQSQLTNQICQASGGPCKYEGGDMESVHAGLQIRESHFNALVEDLVKAMDDHQVPKPAQDQLLGALGPMKGDIVEH